MSSHGSWSSKQYTNRSRVLKVLSSPSQAKLRRSKQSKKISHVHYSPCTLHEKLKCYHSADNQSFYMELKCNGKTVLFLECNSEIQSFSAFISSKQLTLEEDAFPKLLESLHKEMNDLNFDVITALKRNLRQIPKTETKYMRDILTFRNCRGLLAVITVNEQTLIAEGYLRRNTRRSGTGMPLEMKRLIIAYFVEMGNTECFGETDGSVTQSETGLVVTHHVSSSHPTVGLLLSAFTMDSHGAYRFKIKLSRMVTSYCSIGIMQNHGSLLSVMQRDKFKPDAATSNEDHETVIHLVDFLRQKDVIELVLVDHENEDFTFSVYRNEKLLDKKVLSANRRKGAFVPFFYYEGWSKIHATGTPMEVTAVICTYKSC